MKINPWYTTRMWICMLLVTMVLNSCAGGQEKIEFEKNKGGYIFENGTIKIEIDQSAGLVVYRKSEDSSFSFVSEGNASHHIVINGTSVDQFSVDPQLTGVSDVVNQYGTGKRLLVVARAEGPLGSLIERRMTIDLYREFPNSAVINNTYLNLNETEGLTIDKEVNNQFTLDASLIDRQYGNHDFWILQGGSYKERPDWIMPVTDDFYSENYQGQRFELGDVGGGLPVLDVWCKESGLIIGSLREKPTLLSLPARVNTAGLLEVGMEYTRDHLEFTEPYHSISSVIGVHEGDYYNGLAEYSRLMARNGLEMITPPTDAYEAIWCGWGFGPDFTREQMFEMIPVVKALGFKVVTVDAGWYYQNGDYVPRDDTYPLGEVDMKSFVKKFHDNGLKIKLWITTDIAGPEIIREHPEWLLRNEHGETTGFDYMKVQNTPYLCPDVKEVQDYYRQLVRTFIGDWDFDGFKVDQSLINFVGRCYAPDHQHEYPEASVEALPEIFKILYEESTKLKPDAILEVCPCGMFPSYYNMPFYNQSVSSDFVNPWQIRHRGKTLKALMGSGSAYYGDHMERYYSEENLPSMVGVGGIPGTMFVTRPEDNVEFLRVKYPCYLSPDREEHLSFWLDIYNNAMLSSGEYLNLYDIAFDLPEAHVIRKKGIMHYNLFAPAWDGVVEFRGLGEGTYSMIDYVNQKTLGTIEAGESLHLKFEKYLFVKAVPTEI